MANKHKLIQKFIRHRKNEIENINVCWADLYSLSKEKKMGEIKQQEKIMKLILGMLFSKKV